MAPDPRLAATASRLTRATVWDPVGEVPLDFDAGHPQGMVRIDGRWWISTVDLAATRGWVLVVDADGTLLDRVAVGDGVRFHPGGLDFDGEALWVASAEYRPRSSAVVERLVPGEARVEAAFGHGDHVGAVVHLGPGGDLVGWTWGSRRFLRWTVEGELVAEVRNPGHFVDHQDGQWLGGPLVLCGGVGAGPGGIGVLDGHTLPVVREVPFPHRSPATGRPATQNPIHAEVAGGSMVVHLLPDDGRGTILSYAAPLVEPAG